MSITHWLPLAEWSINSSAKTSIFREKSSGQYHGSWYLGPLLYNIISSKGVVNIEYTGHCFPRGRIPFVCNVGKESVYQTLCSGHQVSYHNANVVIYSVCFQPARKLHIVRFIQWSVHTVEYRYNAVQINMALHTSLQEVRQNINQRLNAQKTNTSPFNTSPWRASYGVSPGNILEKIDRVITELHCTLWNMNMFDQKVLTNDIENTYSFWT